MSQRQSSVLVACPDTSAYDHVAGAALAESLQSRTIPVFGQQLTQLKGFPPDTRVIPYEEWRRQHSQPPQPAPPEPARADGRATSDRVCLSVTAPSCVSVGRFLAQATGRSLFVCADEAEWQATARRLIEGGSLKSLTFIVPSWNPETRKAESGWLVRILHLMRELYPVASGLSWGIVTGTDETILSLLAAKSVLQPEIISAYEQAPSVVFTTNDREAMRSPLRRLGENGDAQPMLLVDHQSIMDGSALTVTERPWDVIVFNCHGRSYCACDGFLCGARKLEDDPAAPPRSCVLQLQCYSQTLPQTDPRRFNTPVIVMDSCGTGNWASVVWETGIPSLAFFAIAGAPGAVITGDGITMTRAESYVDPLWALLSSQTMGEATARFNRIRISASASLPYYLLGDPDVPAGAARWPGWTAGATLEPLDSDEEDSLLWHVTAPQYDAPFLRVHLPVRTDEETANAWSVYAQSLQEGANVLGCRMFEGREETEVWLGRSEQSGTPNELVLERRPSTILPMGLAEAAMALPQRVLTWSPPLARTAPQLLQAAERIVKVGHLLERNSGSAIVGAAEDMDTVSSLAIGQWLEGHAASVKAMLELAPGGLWPYRLWSAYKYQAEHIQTPCPYCDLSPTLLRTYHSHPGGVRNLWECVRCDLIEDRPTQEGYPAVSLKVAGVITPRDAVPAALEVDNSQGMIDGLGAGAITIDGRGHGVEASPPVFQVQAGAGEKFSTSVTLTLNEEHPVSHLYRVRGVLLLNGQWFLTSRLVVISS